LYVWPYHSKRLLTILTDEGFSLPDLKQDVFLGIPYANSSRRLHLASSLHTTWTGVRPAVSQGATCPGFGTQNMFGWEIGEDCLNFNLVRPEGTQPGDDLPVMLWIWGGGFTSGSAQDPEFNQSYLVQTSVQIGRPTIVLTINARLSGWGFLNSEQAIRDGVANLGLRDIWKALEWIQGEWRCVMLKLLQLTGYVREYPRIWR
jgi:carboxylesterase type B